MNAKPKALFPRPGEEYVFMPLILDVSIRGGWFWHAQEEPRYLKDLVKLYWTSVALGYTLELNVPPTKEGVIDSRDKQRLREFGAYIDALHSKDYALLASRFEATSTKIGHPIENVVNGDKLYYWTPDCEIFESPESVTLYFDEPVTFDVFIAEEYIRNGQTIAKFTFEGLVDDEWTQLGSGTTVGLRKMVRLSKLTTVTAIRFTVLSTWYNYVPQVSRIGLLVEPSY